MLEEVHTGVTVRSEFCGLRLKAAATWGTPGVIRLQCGTQMPEDVMAVLV
jgi:hypothetical protein